MASFNKVILMGNLTRDPEMRVTPNGLSICKFSIAVNRIYSTADGERREEVTFIDIDSFGRQAETIGKYMTKGRGILVEGRLRLDQWEDKESGQKRSKLGVVLDTFQFVGGRGDDSGGGGASSEQREQPDRHSPPARKSADSSGSKDDDSVHDDVPF
ncbi:MAG: single-stranded DNA-binding protein [Puniceicoccaceae bacterium]|nr:MAG: single-stranded DNA-binding protein [Puniceicoccaceae bacterium]